jgi:hypothetical protein
MAVPLKSAFGDARSSIREIRVSCEPGDPRNPRLVLIREIRVSF